jgi:hypothetical protein
LPPNSENGKNPFEAGCAGAAAAAGDGGAADPADGSPALGRGAGSGTSSAAAEAVAKTTHAIASKIPRAPDPVITLSRAMPSPVPCARTPHNTLVSKTIWRIRGWHFCRTSSRVPDDRSLISKRLFFGGLDQNLALACVVGLPDDAFLLHPFHQRRSTIVADLQSPLNVAR